MCIVFLLVIVVSVFLLLTASHFPFGIFKPFIHDVGMLDNLSTRIHIYTLYTGKHEFNTKLPRFFPF